MNHTIYIIQFGLKIKLFCIETKIYCNFKMIGPN